MQCDNCLTTAGDDDVAAIVYLAALVPLAETAEAHRSMMKSRLELSRGVP